MTGVLEHRRTYLRLMRQFTLDNGFFTVSEFQNAAQIPRSTAQDWVNRLVSEGCIVIRGGKRGRSAATYAAISAVPQSTCRRLFTTVDGERVEIYHDCMSGACAAYCGYHHLLAGGMITSVERDGTLLRECARIGRQDIDVGLLPLPAVGVTAIQNEGQYIIQHIRSIGGPAYSLSDMMAHADGVCKVDIHHTGSTTDGKVWTRALRHVTIGIDDTDTKEGGATFALALALLTHVSGMKGVLPIAHHVVMLNPSVYRKTAGNSASFIEIAVEPESCAGIIERSKKFIAGESHSPDWGIAVRRGFILPAGLREFGNLVRTEIVTRPVAEAAAERFGVQIFGGNGVIGALGAVAMSRLPHEILLDPTKDVPITPQA
ncbi:MAG: tRNA(Ile2) 2-agmatinylcytidine synthetase TiaS [Methanoregula sp. PtaU1.Bin051]|nr:MAG: tRNA(Ile2) 2-agmatinylcytidine synthetase TiaS [Methanoregula sp. PtaU1.Bin051]